MLSFILFPALWLAAESAAALEAQLPSGEIDPTDYAKILVVSDIHGDDQAFIRSLWIGMHRVNKTETISLSALSVLFETAITTGVVPATPLYTGEAIIMIQMGDFIDRGPFGKKCLDIYLLVPKIIGWSIRNLYGNHEMYSLTGNHYDELLHPTEDIDRKVDFVKGADLYQKILDNSLMMVRIATPDNIAFGAHNDPSTLFVHAGIDMEWFSRFPGFTDPNMSVNINSFNRYFRRLIHDGTPDQVEGALGAETSPLMTRYMSTHPNEAQMCQEVRRVLIKFQVSRIVVGHTPQMPHRSVTTRCNGHLLLTDVVMSRWMLNGRHDPADLDEGAPHAMIMSLDKGALTAIEAFYTDTVATTEIFGGDVITPTAEVEVAAAAMQALARAPVQRRDKIPQQDEVDKENQSPQPISGRKRRMHDTPVNPTGDVVLSMGGAVLRPAQMGFRSGFHLSFPSVEMLYDLEYIEAELKIGDEERQHYGIPVIHILPPQGSGKGPRLHEAFLETGSRIHLPSYDRFGYLLSQQLEDITEYFHSFHVCIGFLPVDDGYEDNHEGWVRSFFSVDESGNNLNLINFSRVERGCDEEEIGVELLFVQESLRDYTGEESDEEDADDELSPVESGNSTIPEATNGD